MKKGKINKKSKKKSIYLPIYGNGGFGIADDNNGNKNFNDWYQNNYKDVGTNSAIVHASGVNNMNNNEVNTYGEQGYNSTMAGISKAGPIGSVIGGVSAIGDAIGKPIRKSTESLDNNTGKYNNIGRSERWRTVGNYANPLKAGMDTIGDPNATTGEKIGSFLSIPGVQRSITRRREDERVEEVKKIKHQEAVQRRFADEPQTTMSFKNGGNISGGNNYNSTYGYTPEQIRSAQDSAVVSQQELRDPKTGKTVGYKQYKKGVSGPQYIPINESVIPLINVNNSKIQKANGGQLEGTRYNKDVTYFGNGGSHGENSNGGIPLGNKGKVEEGEVRYKDYIFSNRF